MGSLKARTVFAWLVAFDLVLAVAYVLTNHLFVDAPEVIQHWFDLDAEQNLPTWYSSAQLLVLGLLSALYACRVSDRFLRRFYLLAALAFVFFSADETATFHEGLTALSKNTSVRSFFPEAHGMWIIVYSLGFLALALIFRREIAAFLRERSGLVTFLAGAALFVTGGVLMEIVGYFVSAVQGTGSFPYAVEVTVEESLELLGESLMIYVLLSRVLAAGPGLCRTAAASRVVR